MKKNRKPRNISFEDIAKKADLQMSVIERYFKSGVVKAKTEEKINAAIVGLKAELKSKEKPISGQKFNVSLLKLKDEAFKDKNGEEMFLEDIVHTLIERNSTRDIAILQSKFGREAIIEITNSQVAINQPNKSALLRMISAL